MQNASFCWNNFFLFFLASFNAFFIIKKLFIEEILLLDSSELKKNAKIIKISGYFPAFSLTSATFTERRDCVESLAINCA